MPVFANAQSLVDLQAATNKIRQKEQELNTREQELNAREQRLNVLEQDLIAREDRLKALRAEIDTRLVDLNNAQAGDLDSLTQLYLSTSPKQSAAVFVKMDVAKVASLIRKIPAKEAGRLMNEMIKLDVDFTAKLTDELYGKTTTLEDINKAAK
jgi:flagellar motility protein MotE (MotC chaperone)